LWIDRPGHADNHLAFSAQRNTETSQVFDIRYWCDIEQEAQLSIGCADCTAHSQKTSIRLPVAEKKTIFQSHYSLRDDMVTLLYRTLQSTLGSNTVIRRSW